MSYNLIPVFGAARFGSGEGDWGTEKGAASALEALTKNGVTHLDTAQLYANGESETTLGNLGAAKTFTIDTKWISGWMGKAWASASTVEESAKTSLQKLKTDQVDIFYLHSPDVHTPFAETLNGVQEVYKSGGFKRFGLSNFTAAQCREVFDICKKEGYVKPTVYQMSYSAVGRRSEEELIPLLRENGVSIYAYSPIAGGFLTKNREFIEQQQGRFSSESTFGIYHKMYKSEAFMNLLGKWDEVAKSENVSKAELAYRWTNHHSALKKEHGDGLVFGASSLEQINQTTQYLKAGPLSEKAAKEIDALWGTVKDDAIMDNFQALFA